jgi:hypothetical protein
MKWVTDFCTRNGTGFEIVREALVGAQKQKEDLRYTLRVIRDMGDVEAEYLKEDLLEAQMFALKKWGVPLGAWELHL